MFKAVKKGTQKFRVLEYFNKFPKSDNKKAAKELNLPLPTIRGRKADLKRENYLDTKIVNRKTVDIKTTEKAKTEFPQLSDEEFARDDFIDREIQWRRKLLKTGQTSNPKWKTSTNIEIYTFINSDDSKFDSDLYDELFEAVQKKIPFLTEIDSDGYSDNLVDEYEIDSSFIYPTANLIISGTKYTIELKW